MSSISSRFETVSRAPSAAALPSPSLELNERLTALYAISHRSSHVFASPLGPFRRSGGNAHVPRFVYFGPHSSDDSLRLALYAGFDAQDLRGTLALLHFVERLALAPGLAQGLNLSFFPLVDVNGLLGHEAAGGVSGATWHHSARPELDLLSKDARGRGYYGFVRLETAPDDEDAVTVRLRGATVDALDVELVTSEDVAPWPVRWESGAAGSAVADGPLSIADDLPFQPFELTLRFPAAWTAETLREASASILKRFLARYRGFHAYAQNL